MANSFDMEKVIKCFKQCLSKESTMDTDDICLDEYLVAYEEINKFFSLLGSVFSFVSNDVRSKIDILNKHLHDSDKQKSEQFVTVKRMINYEKSNGLLQDRKYVSGCRTLLRLHRGLEFVYEFLRKLATLKENDSTINVCKDAYDRTLAKYHPWVVKKAANVAMYTLPVQRELLKRICQDVPKTLENLPHMLSSTRVVYDRIDILYTRNDLHDLP